MLRVTMLLLAGAVVAGTAARADENPGPAKPQNTAPAKADSAAPAKTENAATAQPANTAPPKPKSAKPGNPNSVSRTYAAARQLPPGLPRPGYRYRTTVAPATPYRDPVVVETDESLLITEAYGPGGYIRN